MLQNKKLYKQDALTILGNNKKNVLVAKVQTVRNAGANTRYNRIVNEDVSRSFTINNNKQ